MAAARSSRSDGEPPPKPFRRSKVLTTAMEDDAPVAPTPRVVKKPRTKKSAAKKTTKKTAKKTTAKKRDATSTKIAATAKSSRPRMIRPQPVAAVPVAPDEVVETIERSTPRPPRRSATERIEDPPPASAAELVERVSWAIERELNQIELIVGGHRVKPLQRTEAERRARTLASLARTLSEVTRLRAQHQQRPDDDDDAMPRDLDEFREALARRLEGLLAAESQSSGGDAELE